MSIFATLAQLDSVNKWYVLFLFRTKTITHRRIATANLGAADAIRLFPFQIGSAVITAVLLAHERASMGSDLVAVLREEILAVIARHVQVDGDKVQVKMDRDEHVSILEIEVEIPLDAARLAA